MPRRKVILDGTTVFEIRRYDASGAKAFHAQFPEEETNGQPEFDPFRPYGFTYTSHGAAVTIEQSGRLYRLVRKEVPDIPPERASLVF